MKKPIEKPIVLIIDDMHDSAELLSEILAEDYRVEVALSGEMGLMLAKMEPHPDIILLDIVMPIMDGYDVCRLLKASESTRDIPVIFITSRDDVNDETLGLEIGGVDFITKPINPPIVEARIATHLALHQQKKEIKEALNRHISMESMRDNLVCMIAHDLHNPLSEILHSIEIIQGDIAEHQTPMTKSCLDILHNDTTSLVEMVDDLLEISYMQSHIKSLDTEAVSLMSIIDKAILEIAQTKPPIEVDMPDGDIRINCNPRIIRRVIVNQIGCSMKFCMPNEPITVSAERHGEFARVTVHYRGSTIPIEDDEWIIEKFSQSKSKHSHAMPSMCVGLTFCKMAIEAHGGHIGLGHGPNDGNSFWFAIPVASTTPELQGCSITYGNLHDE